MTQFAVLLLVILGANFVTSNEHRLRDLPIGSCQHGGVPKNGGCECALNFEGQRCEKERCFNGGKPYRKTKDSEILCGCPYGFAGEKCEEVTVCENGGELKNGRCVCKTRDFVGIRCAARSSCYHGELGEDGQGCMCDIGYVGPFCEEKLMCAHNGEVTENNDCACVNGWTGELCETCDVQMHIEGELCLPEVAEQSMVASSPSPFDWQFIIIVAAAALLVSLVVLVGLLGVRRFRTKQSSESRVSSREEAGGTDV